MRRLNLTIILIRSIKQHLHYEKKVNSSLFLFIYLFLKEVIILWQMGRHFLKTYFTYGNKTYNSPNIKIFKPMKEKT